MKKETFTMKNNHKRFATTLKNDLLRTLSPFALIGETRIIPKTNRGHKNTKRNGYQNIKPKTILTPEEITIKRMTNWQNHQWMKARTKNKHIAPDTFAAMERRAT